MGILSRQFSETVQAASLRRCKELLIPGCEVWLTAPGTPDRRTKYDLVAVRKDTGILFNIDSQAPTERGIKHIRELIKAKKAGYHAILAFVIQMDGVREVRPSIGTHLEFGEAMEDAKKVGVEVWFLTCRVEPDSLDRARPTAESRGLRALYLFLETIRKRQVFRISILIY